MILLGMGHAGMWAIISFNESLMPLFVRGFTDSKLKVGFVVGLAGVAISTIPPVIGYLSDRTRSRFGRRRPYIAAGALIVLVCWLVLPHAPSYAAIVLVAGVMHLAVAFADTPYLALIGDVAPPSQRATASAYMQFMGIIGGMIYAAIASQLWDRYRDMTIYLVGVAFAGSMFTTIAFIKEPEAPPVEPPQSNNPLRYLKGLLKEKNIMKLLAAQLVSMAGFMSIYAYITSFSVEELGVSEGNSLYFFMVNTASMAIFVLPLGMLGDRMSRKTLVSIMYALSALTHFTYAFAQDFTHILIISGLVALPLAGIIVVGYAFLLDLIPEERTAEFVGLSSVSAGIPLFIGPVIGGRMIDMVGYRALFISGALFIAAGFIIFQFIKLPQEKEDGSEDSPA
jgi:MFS family permease